MTGDAAGFWSYARGDDERDFGRIVRLAELVSREYQSITGTSLNLFVDRNDIAWGEEWRRRIQEALQSTTFFIPVVTPTYFQRPECRKELWAFHAAAVALGVGDLIMPIIYYPVPDFTEDNADDAIALVSRMNGVFFDDTRLEDEASGTHRRAVNGLAKRLAQIAERIEAQPAVPPSAPMSGGDGPAATKIDDDAPGLLDLLVEFEPALEAWTEFILAFPEAIEDINQAVLLESPRMAASAKFSDKLQSARRLADALSDPVQKLEVIGEGYAAKVRETSPGMRALLEVAGQAMAEGSAENRETAETSLRQIRELAASSRIATNTLQQLVASSRRPAAMSRDLRAPLQRMQLALTHMIDAQSFIEEWDEQAARHLT